MSTLGERRESLGSGANYIQVRDSQAFISIPGHVKATQLCTVLTRTKAPGPLNGLPAGLFMVMGFSHTGGHENEDSVLWQIIWVMAELFNLYCIPFPGYCVYVPTTWSVFWKCGFLDAGGDSLFAEGKIRLHNNWKSKMTLVSGHVAAIQKTFSVGFLSLSWFPESYLQARRCECMLYWMPEGEWDRNLWICILCVSVSRSVCVNTGTVSLFLAYMCMNAAVCSFVLRLKRHLLCRASAPVRALPQSHVTSLRLAWAQEHDSGRETDRKIVEEEERIKRREMGEEREKNVRKTWQCFWHSIHRCKYYRLKMIVLLWIQYSKKYRTERSVHGAIN